MSDPFGKSSKTRHSNAYIPPSFRDVPENDVLDLGDNVQQRQPKDKGPEVVTTTRESANQIVLTQQDLNSLIDNAVNQSAKEMERVFHQQLGELNLNLPPQPEIKREAREASVPLSNRTLTNPFSLTAKPLRNTNVRKTPSVKGPDRLNDNGVTKGPTFKQWYREVQGKFHVNSDHYDDDTDKMIFIYSVVEGEAAGFLESVYGNGAPTDLQTSEEMLTYLSDIYRNPHEKQEARNTFRKLYMIDKDAFATFKAKFISLASTGGIAKAEWPEEMYDKVAIRLQNAMVSGSWSNFADLCDQLTIIDGRQQSIREKANSLRTTRQATPQPAYYTPRAQVPKVEAPAAAPKLLETLGAPVKSYTPTKPIGTYSSAKPYDKSKITCFNCKKPGHFRHECIEPIAAHVKALDEFLATSEDTFISQIEAATTDYEEDVEPSENA